MPAHLREAQQQKGKKHQSVAPKIYESILDTIIESTFPLFGFKDDYYKLSFKIIQLN